MTFIEADVFNASIVDPELWKILYAFSNQPQASHTSKFRGIKNKEPHRFQTREVPQIVTTPKSPPFGMKGWQGYLHN